MGCTGYVSTDYDPQPDVGEVKFFFLVEAGLGSLGYGGFARRREAGY